MKKFMCLALAVCMVFVLAGTVLAADLEPQAVNYNNDTYETNIREEDGIGWLLELVYAIEGDDQPVTIRQYDWELKDCCEMKDERCECERYCCCDRPYFIDDPVWLWVDREDGDLPDWISDDWRDYIVKISLDPDCDYLGPDDVEEFNKYPWGDCPMICEAHIWPECCNVGCETTLGCYPDCIPCEVEVLYCNWEGDYCVLDGDSVRKPPNGGPCPDGCELVHDCNWWHPYGSGPSSSETPIIFDRFETETVSGLKAIPTFDEVLFGWDDNDNPMDKVCFVTRPKWYNWSVTACDTCDERVDVVLSSRPKPCCPDSFEFCDEEKRESSCWEENEACCLPPGPQWAVDKPTFAFVRFFEMDLRNCNNITRIDLEFPVCCYCDDDIMWGVWEWVESDACDITDCPDLEGTECSWVPLDTKFIKECESPICNGEECDCKLELGFSGACAVDCNAGELCELEDKVFALGWVAPYVVEDVLDNGIPYSVKAWACDPRNVVSANLVQNAVNPDDSITSEDPLFFRLDFEPGTGEGICKVEVSWILECSEQDLIGFYYWDDDAEDWVELPATWTEVGGGECEVSIVFEGDISDLPGVVIGGGDTEIFDPTPVVPPTDDDDDDDNGTPGGGETPTTSSSSGGCNVGTGAAILMLLVPLGALWFRRF